jgi:hypothetical protein
MNRGHGPLLLAFGKPGGDLRDSAHAIFALNRKGAFLSDQF